MGRKIGKIVIVLGMIFLVNSMRMQAEEIPKPYQVRYEKTDDGEEYYRKAPEIEIEHFDERLVTKYRMIFSDGKELTGTLTKEKNKIVIQDVLLLEGDNCLELWMEDEEGERVEGTETKKVFRIDSTAPEDPLEFIYQKQQESEILCFSMETRIEIRAFDEVSGIKEIYYQFNDQEEVVSEGEKAEIVIPIGFEGTVTAYAVDNAGNRGEKYESKILICENEKPQLSLKAPEGFEHWYNEQFTVSVEIREIGVQSGIKDMVCYINGKKIREENYELKTEKDIFTVLVNANGMLVIETEDYAGNKSAERVQILFDDQSPEIKVAGAENYMITSEPVTVSCAVQDEHKIAAVGGKIVWKNTKGVENIHEIQSWKTDGKEYHAVEELNEDGIYQIYFGGKDRAGNQCESKLQVIIDKENPVISKVEQFQGKQIPFFEWNFMQEEIVQDFTSYTYAVKLDHQLCEPNIKYMEEGKHILEVTAKDAAGNISNANAEFTIDHTVPEIIFRDVEEGETYENEVEVSVLTKSEDDVIENIYVDGIRQEVDQTSRVFRYLFQDPGGHHINVTAKDLAGNKAEKEIQFEVVEKKNILQKIMNRSGKKREDIENINENTGEKADEKKGVFHPIIVGILFLAVIVGIILFIGLKRK